MRVCDFSEHLCVNTTIRAGQDTGRGSEFDRNVALLLKRVQGVFCIFLHVNVCAHGHLAHSEDFRRK